MKKYVYGKNTKIISFRVDAKIDESGTEIRDKIYKLFEKVLSDIDLTEKELNWINGVLEP